MPRNGLNAGFLRRSLSGFCFFLVVLTVGQVVYGRRQRRLDELAAARVQSALRRQGETLVNETRLALEVLADRPGIMNADDPVVRREFLDVFNLLHHLGIETLSTVRFMEQGSRRKVSLTIMAPVVNAPADISEWKYLPGPRELRKFRVSRMFKADHDHVDDAVTLWVPAGDDGYVSALLNVDRFAQWLASTQPQIADRLSFVVEGKRLPLPGAPETAAADPEALVSEVHLGSCTWQIQIAPPDASPWRRVLALQLLLSAALGVFSAWARTLVKQRRFARENFETLVTRMGSAVLTTDEEGRIHYSNPFSDRLFAGPGRSLQGQNVFDSIIPERDRDGARTRLDVKNLFKKMKDATADVNVNENVSLDGRSMWMAWTGSKFRDARGRPLFISVGNDITAQKEAERLLAVEKKRSEQLLHAILPGEKVEELARTGAVAPRTYDHVAVFFTDVVDFTRYTDAHGAEEVVLSLQEMVAAFERICAEHGIEKIKTIGDAFMGVGGLLSPMENPALSATRCALDLVAATGKFGSGWRIRAGVHVGPVQAGVIGASKFLFDVFGDTVNVAARMESNGLPGAVTVSAAVWSEINAHCTGRKHGDVEIKGKGTMEMYVVDGPTT